MDPLSYVSIAYASYYLALQALGRGRWQGWGFCLEDEAALQLSRRPPDPGGGAHGRLDIVIDPAALRGYRWFLGQIYGYPEGGVYFGVPLSNFAGWFLVALILILALQYLASVPAPAYIRDWGRRTFPCQTLLGPALYLGILGFNLGMTFLIGETRLEWAGVFIFLPFLTWLALKHLPGSGQVW